MSTLQAAIDAVMAETWSGTTAQLDALARLVTEARKAEAEREGLSILVSHLEDALEYHQEQTRPIHNTRVALDAARAARAGGGNG